MLDLHYDRLVSDGISGWDLWLLANGWGDAAASASLQPQQGKRKGFKWREGFRSMFVAGKWKVNGDKGTEQWPIDRVEKEQVRHGVKGYRSSRCSSGLEG